MRPLQTPPSQWRLEPVARTFIESLDVAGVAPIHALPPREARAMLVELQAGPIGRPNARVENVTFPLGPGDFARACIVRPLAGGDSLPAVMYFHGGGWVLGDVHTHERLIREISVGTRAVVVFVEMSRAPEAQYPVAIEEAYGATLVTDSNVANGSYTAFRDGPWLTQQTMKWFWDAYLPNAASRALVTASPLKATLDQLWGLPEALVITAENDVLREEGEAYACKLAAAGARVTATRYIGTIHDFVMLNALADSPPTRGAIEQITARLRTALE